MTQEALLRLHAAAASRTPPAFLTTATTRLAIDVLRSARVRREAYTGSWLPEPLVEEDAGRRVEDEEAVSLAFLVLLERLNPDERAVLVLRESFDYPFADIAEILDIVRGQRAPDPQPRAPPRSTTSARASTPTRASAAARRALPRRRPRRRHGRPRRPARPRRRDGRRRRRQGALPSPRRCTAPPASPARLLAFYGQISEEWGVSFEPALVNGQPGFRTARARRPARQRHVARRRGRLDHPPALDRQPRQARPPRADIRRRAAPGADNPTGMTPATPRAGRLRNRDIAPHAQHALHQLPPRDGSLQPRRRCPRGPPPRSQPGVVS